MVKSVLIDDDLHKILVDKQRMLSDSDIKMGLSELAKRVIKDGIDNYVNRLLDNNSNNRL